MTTPLDTLTVKAAALARAAPEVWREYVLALAEFANHHRDNLVKSQFAELPVNQGRAQIATAFHKAMADALTNADKMRKG